MLNELLKRYPQLEESKDAIENVTEKMKNILYEYSLTNVFLSETEDELKQIILRTSRVLDSKIDENAATELARRSRGTPRVANRLFKRVRDFALVDDSATITLEIMKKALKRLKVDDLGLDDTDYHMLIAIIERFNGGPVGLDALASSIGEESSTIEDVYEPYLLQTGLLKRTARGRMVTDLAYQHLKIEKKN